MGEISVNVEAILPNEKYTTQCILFKAFHYFVQKLLCLELN